MPEVFWFGSFSPQRVFLDLGFFQVYWYSLLVTLAIVIPGLIVRCTYLRTGGKEQDIIDFLFYVIIGGLVGARLWHVGIFQWDYYASHLNEIVKIWEGGIAIQGALLGGLLVAIAYARRKKLNLFTLTDSTVIGIPLAQAIGRWGNFFNQELYGVPTTLPWGIYIEPQNRVGGFESFSHFHPAFLYESILNAIFFWLLLKYSRGGKQQGSVTALYFIGYGCIRFIVDFVRIDPMPFIGFLRASQAISLAFVIGGIVFWRFARGRSAFS